MSRSPIRSGRSTGSLSQSRSFARNGDRIHELSNAVDPDAALTHEEAEIYQRRFDDGFYGPLG
jgi:hypothetical protein